MNIRIAFVLALGAALSQPALAQWRASSQQTVGGFVFPESCAYDPAGKALYVGNFGGEKLAPAEKDGLGYLSKVGLDGKVIEQKWAASQPGAERMNKPKGIWIQGERLWVTDIDSVWIFDLKSKKSRKIGLPDVGFANDPAVMDGVLYISDNRNDKLVEVRPADFLNMTKGFPRVSEIFAGMGINPNGVYPTRVGMLLFGGFLAPDRPKGLYALGVSLQIRQLSDPIGRIDGLYEMPDGSLLFTDWNTGSLSLWTDKGTVTKLADGFKGPADFCVIPGDKSSMTVVVPDLPASTLRFVQLRK